MLVEGRAVINARNRFKNVLRQQKARDERNSFNCTGNRGCDCYLCFGWLDYENRNIDYMSSRNPEKKIRLHNNTSAEGYVVATTTRKNHFHVKLFDRTVDLGLFDGNSGLYAVCRLWTKNIRGGAGGGCQQSTGATEVNEVGEGHDDGCIYKLPSPEPLPEEDVHIYFYGSQVKSIRIPAPLPTAEDYGTVWEYINMHARGDDSSLPFPAVLFQNHLDRWKLIRNRWRRASANNDERYAASLKLLQGMYKEIEPPMP